MPFLSEKSKGVRLRIHVQPNAKRNEIIGLHGESLKVKIKAPPEDGRANAELVAFIAEVLGVARAAVSLESGASSRAKMLLIVGVSAAQVRAALGITPPS